MLLNKLIDGNKLYIEIVDDIYCFKYNSIVI